MNLLSVIRYGGYCNKHSGVFKKIYLSDDKRQKILQEISDIETKYAESISKEFSKMLKAIDEEIKEPLVDIQTGQMYALERGMSSKAILMLEERFDIGNIEFANKKKRESNRNQ